MADAREPEQGAGSQEPAQDQGSPTGEDLFDRWLAHRAEGEDTAPRPRTYGVPRTGVPRPEDETTPETTAETTAEPPTQDALEERTEPPAEAPPEDPSGPPVEARGASATIRETQPAPLDLDTGAEPGEAVVDAPATEPSGKHPAAPATSTGLTDFEPVVLASVRRSEEQPTPTPRFGRRRRAESRAPAPADESAPTDETPDETADEAPDEAPDGTPADLPAATTAEADREPPAEAPPPEPEVEPEPDAEPPATPATPATPASAAAEVFAAFNDTAAPGDVPSSDDPGDTPATPAGRRRPARTPRPPRVRTGKGAAMGTGLARYAAGARELLDRSVRGAPEDRPGPAPTSPPTSGPTSGPAPAARHDASRQESTTDRPQPTDPVGPSEGGARSTSAYDALRAQREAAVPPRPAVLPPDIDFRPRTLARQVTSLLLLVGIALTLLAAWRAYDSRVQTDIGFAAILALFTGIVWAVRAGSVPTRMSLHGGLLEVRTQAGRFLFELTSAHTHLEQVGTPGRPGWKVLVHRRGMHPFEITRGMVDPHEFLDAVRYYRPDL